MPKDATAPSATTTSPSPTTSIATPAEILSTNVAAAPAGVPKCATSMMRLGYGDQVGAATGEHAVMYSLTNYSGGSCWVRGFPAIALLNNSGKALPFRYTQEHSQYMTSAAPRTVLVPPNASAYFLVAKYRCDLGPERDAVSVSVIPPSDNHRIIAAASPSKSAGVETFSYCKGGGHDPGQTVAVSPVLASQLDANPGH